MSKQLNAAVQMRRPRHVWLGMRTELEKGEFGKEEWWNTILVRAQPHAHATPQSAQNNAHTNLIIGIIQLEIENGEEEICEACYV